MRINIVSTPLLLQIVYGTDADNDSLRMPSGPARSTRRARASGGLFARAVSRATNVVFKNIDDLAMSMSPY
jgi:hypothetical protein